MERSSRSLVFKTSAINHSAIFPFNLLWNESCCHSQTSGVYFYFSINANHSLADTLSGLLGYWLIFSRLLIWLFYSSYMPGGSYYPVPSHTVASFLHKTCGSRRIRTFDQRIRFHGWTWTNVPHAYVLLFCKPSTNWDTWNTIRFSELLCVQSAALPLRHTPLCNPTTSSVHNYLPKENPIVFYSQINFMGVSFAL